MFVYTNIFFLKPTVFPLSQWGCSLFFHCPVTSILCSGLDLSNAEEAFICNTTRTNSSCVCVNCAASPCDCPGVNCLTSSFSMFALDTWFSDSHENWFHLVFIYSDWSDCGISSLALSSKNRYRISSLFVKTVIIISNASHSHGFLNEQLLRILKNNNISNLTGLTLTGPKFMFAMIAPFLCTNSTLLSFLLLWFQFSDLRNNNITTIPSSLYDVFSTSSMFVWNIPITNYTVHVTPKHQQIIWLLWKPDFQASRWNVPIFEISINTVWTVAQTYHNEMSYHSRCSQ